MISRRHLLATPFAALAANCPASIGLITDSSAPHLQNYLDSIKATGIARMGITDASGASFPKAQGFETFRDPAAMLDQLKPGLTIVSMEAHHAPPAIRLALEKGSHVLAEKPACVTLSDFEALVTKAKRNNKHLMLAFAKRMNPPAIKARGLIVSGAIGRVMGVQASYIADQTRLTRPEYQRSWFADPTKALGGHIAWLGIHTIDLIQFITQQRFATVVAMTANIGGQPIQIEDSAALSLKLEKGALVTLHSAYYLDKGNSAGVTVWGADGWLRFDPDDAKVPLEWYSPKTGKHTEPWTALNSYAAAVKNAACDATPFVTADESLQALKVVFAAYESAKTGRVTKI